MNQQLIRSLERALGGPLIPIGSTPRIPANMLPEASHCTCGTDPFALVKVAIVVKYGGSVKEAAFKFNSDVDAILDKHGVGKDEEPSLTTKLEALKAEVGEETYNKLLANPEVEKMASRAYRRSTEGRNEAAITEIAALLNNAIPEEQLAFVLSELSEDADPIATLAEA